MGNPENPYTNTDSQAERVKQTAPVARQEAKAEGKKSNPYETVPKAPGLTKQIFLSNPFKAYKDIIDADSKTDGIEKKEVPTIFSIMQSEFEGQFVQVSDGKETFWINTKETKPEDWSIHMGYLTSEFTDRAVLRLAPQPFAREGSSRNIPVAPDTFYPAFEQGSGENGEEDTWRIGMDLEGNTKELKQGTLWTQARDTEYREIGKHAVFVIERDLQRFVIAQKALVESLTFLSLSERKSSDQILNMIRLTFLKLAGATNVSSPQSVEKTLDYVRKKGFTPDILNLTLDDVSRMDDQAYKQLLNRLTVCQKYCEESLAGRRQNMEKDIVINGVKTKCFIIPMDQLP